MRIGVDFDNTLVCYDGAFHAVACELGLISSKIPAAKRAIRDHLRVRGQEDAWTRLQGYVYGARMDLACLYPGAGAFCRLALQAGLDIAIISHKTRLPYKGDPYDLHGAAMGFLESAGFFDPATIGLSLEQVYFEPTRSAKFDRIRELECSAFVDDLPEFLTAAEFPASTEPILFDPQDSPGAPGHLRRGRSWSEIGSMFLASTAGHH